MDKLATLTVFSAGKQHSITETMAAHLSRSEALKEVFNTLETHWEVKEWGYVLSEQVHDPVYMTIECKDENTLDLLYTQQNEKLVTATLPTSIRLLLQNMRLKQHDLSFGEFKLYSIYNELIVVCNADGAVDFTFHMKPYRVWFNIDAASDDFAGSPTIIFDDKT